jgi:tetratricopeptide (TPR) repeat protein
VLALPSGQAPTAARAKALIGAGGMAWWVPDAEAAGRFYAEAVDVERRLGDKGRLAEALYNQAFVVAGDDIGAAMRLLDEALEDFRAVDDQAGVARTLAMLVIGDAQAERWAKVATSLEEAIAILRRSRDRLNLAFDLLWLSFAYGRLGRRANARSAGLEALRLFKEGDNPTGIGIALTNIAFLATWEGRHEDAIRLAAASSRVKQLVGGPRGGFARILEGDPADEARGHVDADTAERAWEEGSRMSLDDAVKLAEDSTNVVSEASPAVHSDNSRTVGRVT